MVRKLDKFQLWIKENKIKNVAKKMKEGNVTVWYWFKRSRVPKPKTALRIIKSSNLTWADIYQPFAERKTK